MPKHKGENTKSVEARQRKAEVKAKKDAEIAKKKEDELWKDDNKLVATKLQRKEDREKKKLEVLERKRENQKMYEQELESLPSSKPKKSEKLTRAAIVERQVIETKEKLSKKSISVEEPITENLNRMSVDGDEARNIDEAITILNKEQLYVDRHPEKRMKAAYNAYVDANFAQLKADNPSLRHTQLHDILRKNWVKCPDNPLNQPNITYNSKN